MKKRKTYYLSRFKNTTISNILLIQKFYNRQYIFLNRKKKMAIVKKKEKECYEITIRPI